jgi:hypothetical protein
MDTKSVSKFSPKKFYEIDPSPNVLAYKSAYQDQQCPAFYGFK